jgi:ribosomal protein S18 acetylase RimI-like enzyme
MRIRDAAISDSFDLATLHALAADGLVEWCYEGAVTGADPIELLARVFKLGQEPYSYRNCVVAEDAGRIVGKLHSYAWDDAAAVMPSDPCIPDERMAVINAMAPPTPSSWHIEAMAVLPEYQGRGLGRLLIDIAKSQARTNNFDLLSLHVFESNKGAIRLYEHCGFRAVDRAPIPDGLPMADRGGSLLMVFP